MKYITLWTCILIQIYAFGQQKGKPFRYNQAKAKFNELQFSNPDSSKIYLDQILANKTKLHDTLIGQAYNDYGVYYAITRRDSLALVLFNTSIEQYKKYPKDVAGVLINCANVYKNAGKYDKAIVNLNKALAIFKAEKYPRGIAIVYGDLSANYYYQLKNAQAVNYAIKSIAYFEKINDSKFLAIQRFRLANMYSKLKNLQFALKLYQECLPEFAKDKINSPNYYLALLNIGDCYFELKQHDKAAVYYQDAATGLKAINNTEFYILASGRLGKIYSEKKKYTLAKELLQASFNDAYNLKSTRLMEISTDFMFVLRQMGELNAMQQVIQKMDVFPDQSIFNLEDKLYFQKEKALYYKSQNNFQMANSSMESIIQLQDSIYQLNAQQQADEIQAKYQTKIQKQENTLLENQVKNNRIFSVLFSLLFVIIALGVYYFYKIKFYKLNLKAKRAEVLEREQALLVAQSKFDKQNIKNLDEIAELKQRELTALTMQYASLQETLTSIIKESPKAEANSKLIKNIKSAISQTDYWSEFILKFSQVHPNFHQNLKAKYPTLTQKDSSFCTLIKLNLSNKEIANMMQVSHSSIISKKYLLKRKLGLKEDEDLATVISTIE